MSVLTEVLKLFKYDPATDGGMTFNLRQALNDNWDKIDAWASGIKTTIAGLVPGTRKINNKELSADVILTGDDIKTSNTDDTPIGDVVSVLGGATTPQGALAALGAGVQPNLLDNAIFIGGGSQQGGGQLPVNQRGQTSYTAAGSQPIFDRWKANNATVSLNADDITVTGNQVYGNMTQLIENWDSFAGKTVTLSALITGGDGVGNGAYIDILDGVTEYITQIASVGLIYKTVTLPDNITKLELGIVTNNVAGKTLGCKAIKFELGSTQTLAYQDDTGAWQLLPQPESDYATQLLKCQRYYYRSDMRYSTRPGHGNRYLNIPVQFPVVMRIPPTVTVKSFAGTANMLSDWASALDADISVSANAPDVSKDGIGSFVAGADMNPNTVYGFCFEASADL